MLKNNYKIRSSIIFLSIALIILTSSILLSEEEKKDLRPKYQQWLKEVQYIMTEIERRAFDKLETDEQRDRFINAFWAHRDPTPGTPKNEFKDEHYRRWDHANKFLGRDTSREGWQTDMGRMYILLGEPLETKNLIEVSVIYPTKLWFYAADPKKGLPAHFYLVFYKRSGAGEYKLYSPFGDGVRSLISDPSLVYGSEYDMYWAIRQNVDGEMADAAFNLVPGEYFDPRFPRATFRSQDLLNSIEDLPNKVPEPLYAEAILQGRPIVEMEYRFHTLEPEFLSHYFRGPDGDFFLYYGWKLPPQKVSLGQYEEKYYFSYDIEGQLMDTESRNLFNINDKVFSYLSQKEFDAIKAAPISYQNRLAINPGFYTLNLLIKNPVSKEYGSIRQNVYIPDLNLLSDSLYMSQVLAGYKIDRVQISAENKPFQFNDILFHPLFSNIYLINTKIYLYFQIYCPVQSEKSQEPKYTLRYSIYEGDKELSPISEALQLSQADSYGTISQIKELPLTGLGPGDYTLRISLIRNESGELASREIEFSIINERSIYRPLVLAKKLPYLQDSSNNQVRAMIYLAQDEQELAIQQLEKAAEKNPDDSKVKKILAQLLIQVENYRRAIQILNPLFVKDPNNFEILGYLAVCHHREGNYSEAIRFYEIALRIKPENTSLLNATADAYLKKGDKAKALEYFQKSLEIDPDQADIKEEVNKLQS
jgi:GWxTD domain-containing protein